MMAKVRVGKMVFEVAPPTFVSVVRRQTQRSLDTIFEEDRVDFGENSHSLSKNSSSHSSFSSSVSSSSTSSKKSAYMEGERSFKAHCRKWPLTH
ncbi:hypothetical protein AMTRI_Chr02g212060 [Amborella trichopoda]